MSSTHRTADGKIVLIHRGDWSGDDFNSDIGITERHIRRATELAVYIYMTDLAVSRVESMPLKGVV